MRLPFFLSAKQLPKIMSQLLYIIKKRCSTNQINPVHSYLKIIDYSIHIQSMERHRTRKNIPKKRCLSGFIIFRMQKSGPDQQYINLHKWSHLVLKLELKMFSKVVFVSLAVLACALMVQCQVGRTLPSTHPGRSSQIFLLCKIIEYFNNFVDRSSRQMLG